jgi:outer membrane protein TolC
VQGIDPIDDTWNIGVNVSLPLFEGGATSVNIQQTKIEINKLKEIRAQLMQYLELGVHAAVLEANVKMVNLESSKRSAEFANKSLDLVQAAYAKGGVSVVELIDAQNAALNAESNALNSVYEFLTSILKAERAVGKYSLLSTAEEREEFTKRRESYFNENLK